MSSMMSRRTRPINFCLFFHTRCVSSTGIESKQVDGVVRSACSPARASACPASCNLDRSPTGRDRQSQHAAGLSPSPPSPSATTMCVFVSSRNNHRQCAHSLSTLLHPAPPLPAGAAGDSDLAREACALSHRSIESFTH